MPAPPQINTGPVAAAVTRLKLTEEELTIMCRMEQGLRGDPRINVKIADALGGRFTCKQISGKRLAPSYIRARDHILAQAVEAEVDPAVSSDSSPERLPNRRLLPLVSESSSSDQSPVGLTPPQDDIERRRPGTPQGAGDVHAFGTPLSASTRGGDSEGGSQPDGSVTPAVSPLVVDHPVNPVHGDQLGDVDTGSHERADPLNPSNHSPHAQDTPNEVEWRTGLLTQLRGWDPAAGPEGVREPSRLIRDAARLPEISQEVLDTVYGVLAESLSAREDSSGSGRVRASGPRTKRSKKRAQKRYRYARTQDLYKKDPALLAKHVRLGTDHTVQSTQKLARVEVETLYKALWGTKAPTQLEDIAIGVPIGLDMFKPIEAAEVRQRLGKVKGSSAGGPDKLRKSDLTGRSREKLLAGLYNLVLSSGRIPTAWRYNRTTLIPKEGKDGSKVENYRPITISSLLSRLFWGIVDARLRKVVRLSPRQKGFVAEAGCFANINLLDQLNRLMKQRLGGVGIVLDLAKAFDTIPHGAIGRALRRKGVPEPIVGLIESSYRTLYTRIAHPDGDIEIQLQRGVKQGDPLSPLIFNLILEELLERLESMPGYELPGGENISVLAFADDLLLMASDAPKAQALLDTVVEFLENHGMSLSVPKCTAYRIAAAKSSWYLADPGIHRRGEYIRVATPDEPLTYLGVKYSLWSGIDLGSVQASLTGVLHRVERLALKPDQKLHLIKTYLIPGYLHALVTAVPERALLKSLDTEVRVAIRNIMHLPQSVCNGLLYCAQGDGGLGIPRFEHIVPRVALQLGLRFQNSSDPAVRALHGCASTTQRLRRTAASVRINYPYTASDLRQFKRRCARSELETWRGLEAQGKAVSSFKGDKVGNAIMRDPSLLKPTRFITALQLRTNTAGNRTTLNRARQNVDPSCRKCRVKLETLNHILGECTYTKPARIRRHDDIVKYIECRVMNIEGTEVSTEPNLKHPNGEKAKPDLVMKNRAGVFVVDVTVRHEDGDHLTRAAAEKVRKYKDLLPQVREMFSALQGGEVLPIVVGTRGAMPKATLKHLRKLGIGSAADHLTISLMALRSSIEMYHEFIDYD